MSQDNREIAKGLTPPVIEKIVQTRVLIYLKSPSIMKMDFGSSLLKYGQILMK